MRCFIPHLYFKTWGCYRVKSEREKQIPYIKAYIQNLEEWYCGTYLQGRNRDADRENGLVYMGRRGRVGDGGTNWESSMDICTLPRVKQRAGGKLRIAQAAQLGALWRSRGVGCGVGGRFQREWVLVCIRLMHSVVRQKPTQHCKAIMS